ncbi:MAG: Crp/Fnr family transcriptional regulator [Muribaculaceae bacterium]|nr:Crp/Fnr family transcriptional regulator [Muribaculaceae bacterium]
MDLPLFQGMSHEKVSELIEKTKFHFLKFNAGDKVIITGESCEYVRFLISGSLKIIYNMHDADVSLSSVISAPAVVGIEYLFGKERSYPFSAVANTDCAVLQISKNDYVTILQSDNVFLFNLVNLLSHASQKSVCSVVAADGSVASRLALDVMMLTAARSTNIRFEFKQKDLCLRLGVQRPTLINALDNLQDAGVITYDATSISIPDRDSFLAYTLK